MFNTPPVFGVYMFSKVLRWIESSGGLSEMQKRNEEKAKLLYDEIDADEFYSGTTRKESRSRMNVTFRLKDELLEKAFLAGAEKRLLMGLKGHRSVGGIRASIYNACEREIVEALVEYMREFRKKNG
jgi:phosphoserine aminotransferase